MGKLKCVDAIQYEKCKISRYLTEFELNDIELWVPIGICMEEQYNTYPNYIYMYVYELERLKLSGLTDCMIKSFREQTKIRSLMIYSQDHEMLMIF